MRLEGDLDDESFSRRFLEVERLEDHQEAFQRVQENRFIVFPSAAVGAGEECDGAVARGRCCGT